MQLLDQREAARLLRLSERTLERLRLQGDRWSNLRGVTAAQNSWNSQPTQERSRPDSDGLARGVHKATKNRYKVLITANGVTHYFGYYADKATANAVAAKAYRQLHGQHGYVASRSGRFFRRA
jgi:hypothetical protein